MFARVFRFVLAMLVWFLVGLAVAGGLQPGAVCSVAADEPPFVPAFDLCRVSRIIDGDTFVALCKYRDKVIVRVHGIDTYESKVNNHIKKQLKSGLSQKEILARGKLATHCAARLLLYKPVVLVFKDRRYDVYNRLLAVVYIPDKNRFVNYADEARQYCNDGVYE